MTPKSYEPINKSSTEYHQNPSNPKLNSRLLNLNTLISRFIIHKLFCSTFKNKSKYENYHKIWKLNFSTKQQKNRKSFSLFIFRIVQKDFFLFCANKTIQKQ